MTVPTSIIWVTFKKKNVFLLNGITKIWLNLNSVGATDVKKSISWLHMLLLKALLRFLLLSAHKGAIRNKDPIKPSDVSTGTTALGYCSWQMKRSTSCMFVSYLKSKVVNFELCFTTHTPYETLWHDKYTGQMKCFLPSSRDRTMLSQHKEHAQKEDFYKELRNLEFCWFFFKKVHF